MTTERIDIIVSEDGSRVVKKRLEDVGESGKKAGAGTNILQQALLGLASGAAVAVLGRLVDTYSNMISRLRLVTSGTSNLVAVNNELFASANRTRSSYDATVELFAKLSTGAKALGVSQRDLLDITETVNQAIQVSGASSMEAAGGLRQLGQAIASGTLRGDELNSILENMPRLGQAIAEGMGKSVGELRALGAEGKLTASAIISALKDQAPQIAAEFAQVQPTISSAFQVLTNNAVRFIGELDQASGISRVLANGLILLANNLDVVAGVLVTVGVALVAVYGPSLVAMLGVATGAVRTFTLALMSNPLGLLAVALSTAVVAVLAFGDSLKVVQDDLKTTADESISMKDIFFETFVVLGQEAWAAANVSSQAWDESLTSSGEKGNEFKATLGGHIRELVDNTRKEVNFIVGLFVGTYRAITTVWSELPRVFKDIAITSANFLIDALETAINKVATLLIAGPLAPFVNGGKGLELINIPRLQNDAEGAARIVGGVVAGIFREETSKDWVGNAIRGATENVQERRRNAGGLNPGGPASPLANADDAAAKKAAKDAEQAADILSKYRQQSVDNIRLAGVEASERRVLGDMLQLDSQLREKNAILIGAQRAEVEAETRAMYRAQDIAQERDRLMAQLTGREEAYTIGLAALNQVVDRGAISQARYNQELAGLDYERLVGELDATSGAMRGLLAIQMELADEGSRVERATVGIWQQARGPLIDYQAELTAIGALYDDLKLSGPEAMQATTDATIAYLSTLRDVASGARRAFLSIGADMTDAATNIERTIRNAFSAAEDALTKFITTGKLDLADFWKGLQEDLARNFVREQVLGPLANMLGLSGSAVGIPLGEKGNPMHVIQANGGPGTGDITDPSTWWERAQQGGGSFFERIRQGWSEVTAQGGNTFSKLASFISNLLSSSGGGQGGGNWLSSLIKVGTSIFSAASGGGGGGLGDLEGLYATGTSFRVGGQGGVDSQRVSFWASPGEDVSVSRAGQRQQETSGGDFYLSVDARGSNDPAAVEEAVERGIRAAEPVFIMKARRAAGQDVRNTFGRQKL